MPFRSPLLVASLPAVWFCFYFAAWHFMLTWLLYPLSLLALAVPLFFGYAAALMKRSTRASPWPPALPLAAGASVAISVLAYGSCLYGAGAVHGLVPEKYKFGGSTAYLSLSTVHAWAWLTSSGMLLAAVLERLQPSGSTGAQFARASVGMFAAGAALLVPLLLTGKVLFRA